MSKNDDLNNYDDELPSEQEGSYEDQTGEEDYVDESSDEWSEEAEQNQPAPKKKNSALTTIIVIVVAVVAVIGFLVVKGSGNAPVPEAAIGSDVATTTPPVTDGQIAVQSTGTDLLNLQNQAPTEMEPTQAPDPIEQAPQGLMDNPEIVNQAPKRLDQPPVPTMTGIEPQPMPIAPSPEEEAGVVATLDSVTPDVKPVSDFPTVDSIKKPDPAQSLTDTTLVPPAEQQQPVAVAPLEPLVVTEENQKPSPEIAVDVQAQLNDAAAKIAELQKSLADKDTELQLQKEKSSLSSSEIDSLKQKISKFESRLADQDPENSAETPVTEVSIKEDVIKSAPTQKSATKQQVTKPAVKKIDWVLKSAKSGHAVISDASTGDYRTVSVGSTVAGLGKIISIRETSAGWVVQGTQGKISE